MKHINAIDIMVKEVYWSVYPKAEVAHLCTCK